MNKNPMYYFEDNFYDEELNLIEDEKGEEYDNK